MGKNQKLVWKILLLVGLYQIAFMALSVVVAGYYSILIFYWMVVFSAAVSTGGLYASLKIMWEMDQREKEIVENLYAQYGIDSNSKRETVVTWLGRNPFIMKEIDKVDKKALQRYLVAKVREINDFEEWTV